MKTVSFNANKKRIIKYTIFSFLALALIASFLGCNNTQAEAIPPLPSFIQTPFITITPSSRASSTPEPPQASVTPTPLPTPTPHPGDRDMKFLTGDIFVDDTTYRSADLSIEITKTQTELITYYVAEVYFRNNDNYYSAFSYGEDNDRIQRTSDILHDTGGMLAVSGDYYNARDYGLIIRNGVLLRKHSSTEIMAIFDDGSMKTYPIKGISADDLLAQGALHSYAFGPALLEDGQPVESYKGRTKQYLRDLQPRCAVGMIEPYHYVFVVVDGRSEGYSQGVTMEELSELMYGLGCVEAYNLDGGGSATMVFMGTLVNRPLGREGQRKVADAIIIRESN